MDVKQFNALYGERRPAIGGASWDAARAALVNGLGINEAARHVGLSPSTVSRYINRRLYPKVRSCPHCGGKL